MTSLLHDHSCNSYCESPNKDCQPSELPGYSSLLLADEAVGMRDWSCPRRDKSKSPIIPVALNNLRWLANQLPDVNATDTISL